MTRAFLFLIFTIATASAHEAWVQYYHGLESGDDVPIAVAADSQGNVVVTGYSLTTNGYPDYDYVTIKYSGAGMPLWTNEYDGSAHSQDVPAGMVLDQNGNIFVTGQSYDTNSDEDFATIAYASGGTPLWTNLYTGPRNDPETIAIDTNGNIYVSGNGWNGAYLNVVVKYSNSGVPLWTNLTAGVEDGNSYVTVDGQGNVYTAATSPNPDGNPEYATLKLSNAGVSLWTNYYVGPGNYSDIPAGIALGKAGNVLVTGSSFGSGSGFDYATLAYSPAGIPLWTNRYNGPGNDWDMATAIAVDNNSNVVVTGDAPVVNGGPHSWGTVAYSPNGVQLWANSYSASGGDATPSALTMDKFGNIIVTGNSTEIGTSTDYGTIAYSSTGMPLWTNLYNGPDNDADGATAIATDSGGNVIVTGFSTFLDSGANYATIKYIILSPIPLTLQLLHKQAVLTWTNSLFNLQSAPTIQSPFTTIPGATSPYTNAISGKQQFFKLMAN